MSARFSYILGVSPIAIFAKIRTNLGGGLAAVSSQRFLPPYPSENIFIFWCTVKPACLFIMTFLTQALPVTLAPHKFLVSSMGYDVVNYRCRGELPFSFTLHTQWMFIQVQLGEFPPLTCVPTAVRRLPFVQGSVQCTIATIC